MAQSVEPLRQEWIPALSDFLKNGFCRPGEYSDFTDPDVLRWQIFDRRGPWEAPRSLVIRENEKIVAHVGLATTEFVGLGQSTEPVPAVHMIAWLSRSEGGSLGSLLMLRAFGAAPVQYAFGCTAAAARVLLRTGFVEVLRAPVFHRVVSRFNPAVWATLHGHSASARGVALRLVDFAQSLRRARKEGPVKLKRVERFDKTLDALLRGCAWKAIATSRSSDLLNYYLNFPKNNFRGFFIEHDGISVGFAMTAMITKPGFRHGRIVECLVVRESAAVWRGAIMKLEKTLADAGADLITCVASAPLLVNALQESAFFRRGKIPFYLRDPKKKLSAAEAFHLTLLEADLSYI